MASETSGDCVGVCEHPARIPTISSASEAKHAGKVLILDLLITHQAVLSNAPFIAALCFRTDYPQSTSGGLGNSPPAADVVAGATPAATLRRGPSPAA